MAQVFQDFTYHREFTAGDSVGLEFSAKIGDLSLKGIDLIRFDEAGKIVDFEVMIRPANALAGPGPGNGQAAGSLRNHAMTPSTAHLDTQSAAALATVRQFNDAVNRHDLSAIMALMTADCVFENTYPPPDGERFAGQVAVGNFWRQFFAASPTAVFTSEEEFACGDRAVVRWRYQWGDAAHGGHIRGVDIFRVQDGRGRRKTFLCKRVVRER